MKYLFANTEDLGRSFLDLYSHGRGSLTCFAHSLLYAATHLGEGTLKALEEAAVEELIQLLVPRVLGLTELVETVLWNGRDLFHDDHSLVDVG